MTVYMPPIDRKKKVPDRYNPDTFRVISTNAEDTHPKYQQKPYARDPNEWKRVERGPMFPEIECAQTHVLPRPTPDARHSNPHPTQVNFLREDVALLNEPVCVVYTKAVRPVHEHWWPSRPNEGTLQKPGYSRDTVYRNDFMYDKEHVPKGSCRFSANPNTTPARGGAPVNFLREKDGSQRFYKEGLSYEQQYNCRVDPNYPIRGKRHGAFVWDRMSKDDTQRLIDYQSKLDQEERQQMEAEKFPSPTTKFQLASARPCVKATEPQLPNPKSADPAIELAKSVPSPPQPSSPKAATEE